MQADLLSDLNQVIQSLYLESSDIDATIQELEKLVSLHQSLACQGTAYAQELAALEQQIFWLLGFKIR